MGIATSTLTAKMDDTSDTDDLKTAYRRRKKRRKRHESDTDTSCGASETLPASVAKWTEADLQTILVTYAATGHEEPHSVLDTVTKACKLSELSDSAQKIISYLDETIDFEFKLDENGEIPVLEKELINIKDQLESVYQRVAVSPLKETLTGFDAMARLQIFTIFGPTQFFIEQLQNFVEYQENFQQIREQFYTDTFKHFGQMCGLRGESGRSIVKTVEIAKVNVSSYPDIRFKQSWHQSQLPDKKTILCVSVVEEKKPHSDASEMSLRKTRGMDASGESTSHASSDFTIESYLNDRELGRHGGELIAEWKYTVFNPCVVGMVVCGFKVILTVLEMKRKDFFSLNSSGKLTQHRVVEYTKPLDILQRKDRKVLYELLFRLAECKPS